MRKLLVGVLIVLVVVVAAYCVADVVIRHQVQADLATAIDQQVHAERSTVDIDSFPFTGRLAASGDVPTLTIRAEGVPAGSLTLQTVDARITDLHVDRHELYQGTIRLTSIRRATIVATIAQADIQRHVGAPVVLGAGTLGLDGRVVAVTPMIVGDTIEVQVPGVSELSLTIPPTGTLPCLAHVAITPGALVVGCQTDVIPPAIAGLSTSF